MPHNIFQARKNQKYNSLSPYAKLYIDLRKCGTDEKKFATAIQHNAVAVIKWFMAHKNFSGESIYEDKRHALTSACYSSSKNFDAALLLVRNISNVNFNETRHIPEHNVTLHRDTPLHNVLQSLSKNFVDNNEVLIGQLINLLKIFILKDADFDAIGGIDKKPIESMEHYLGLQLKNSRPSRESEKPQIMRELLAIIERAKHEATAGDVYYLNDDDIDAVSPNSLPLTAEDHRQIAEYDAMPSSVKIRLQPTQHIWSHASSTTWHTGSNGILNAEELSHLRRVVESLTTPTSPGEEEEIDDAIELPPSLRDSSPSSRAQNTVQSRILNVLESNMASGPRRFESTTAGNPDHQSNNPEVGTEAAEIMQSAKAILSGLTFSIFQKHGIKVAPRENDHQKSCRFYDEGRFEEALESIVKFKKDTLDTNPYPLGHEKAASVFVVHDTYRLMANCYRHLRRYSDAIQTLEDMQCIVHNALPPTEFEKIAEKAREWEVEAKEYAASENLKSMS